MSKSIYARIKQAKQDSSDHKWKKGMECEFFGVKFTPTTQIEGVYQVTPKFMDYNYVRVMRKQGYGHNEYTLKVCSKDGSPIRDFPVTRKTSIEALLKQAAESIARVKVMG